MLTETSKYEPGYFTEADSAEVVISRNANARDRRLKQVMEVIVRKLHEAVKEIEPTNAEWMMAIEFLTKTGQKCNEWRQEWILLSDILGVSMLVDAINNRKPSGATETTVLGPFYVVGCSSLSSGREHLPRRERRAASCYGEGDGYRRTPDRRRFARHLAVQ